jgi:hypothetical protein
MLKNIIDVVSIKGYYSHNLTTVRLVYSSTWSGIMPRGKNPPSGQFGSGQRQPHIGASRSQSGQPQRSQTPRPQRGNGGGQSFGAAVSKAITGKGATQWGHGGTKKNRNKGKGSR